MKSYINRYIVVFLSLLLTLPFLIRLDKVKIEDNVDYFHDKENPQIIFYDKFKKLFENDEFFIIAFKKKDIFTSENLSLVKLITEDLEKINEIREVKSLSNIDYTVGENEFFIVRKFLETIPAPENIKELSELKEEALSNTLLNKNFISKDGKTVAIIVYVYEKSDDGEYRKKIINKCRTKLAEYKSETGEIFIGGWTITNYYLSHLMQKDLKVFIPVTYLFITIAVFFIFRNLWLVLLSFLNISMCMICTMGLFYYLNISINNVTTIIPPLIMALALCDTVHIFSYLSNYSFKTKNEKRSNIIIILKKLLLPCFLTTLTTAVGFASLSVSDIPPIKDFAKAATIGMFFEFVFAFTFLPSMLLLVPFEKKSPKKTEFSISKLLEFISKTVTSDYILINFIGFAVIGFSVYFALDISTETNVIEYFKKNSEIQKSNQFIKKNLAGLSTFDISIKGNEEDLFKDPEALKVIEKIQNYADKTKGVDKTLSFVDFLKDMNKSFHNENNDFLIIPESREMVSQYLLIYDSENIRDYINSNFDHARIFVRISEDSTKEQSEIINKINSYIEQSKFDGYIIKITGRVFIDVNMIDSLVKSQIWSLFTAGIIILSLMFIIMKSFKLGLLSVIPNLVPIIINFGIMGFFGIPLNAATALIAAVALGIAVDDTIHFLTAYSKYSKEAITVSQAVKLSIMDKGKAIITSSFVLTIGFGTLVFSSFVPSIYFGLLCSIIMVTAVIGDLFFLPALILLTNTFTKRGNC